MAKWIQNWEYNGITYCIQADEVHTSHVQLHNSLSGNPQYKVRLEIPWSQVNLAISQLLGRPEKWPFLTPLNNVVAVEANIVNDAARYTTDAEGNTITYTNNALVDVTYIPRNGEYVRLTAATVQGLYDTTGQDVYWDDTVEGRFETIPLNHLNFIWGNTADTVPTALTRQLHSQEAPFKIEPGQTLVHTIEGWCGTMDVGEWVGTVTNGTYTSVPLGQSFFGGALMLRSYSFSRAFTFRSYRPPQVPALGLGFQDFTGRATLILKLHYEYKDTFWEKFHRNDPALNQSGRYYIRYRESPHAKLVNFPPKNHDLFLKSSLLDLDPVDPPLVCT